MYAFPIGVMLDSFLLPVDAALDAAKQLGADGIQVYTVSGERTPETMDMTARREFLHKVKSRGMVISALCGDLGKGFTDPAADIRMAAEFLLAKF